MAARSPSEAPCSPPKFCVLSLNKILSVYSLLKKKLCFMLGSLKKYPKKTKNYACSLCLRNKNPHVFSLPKNFLCVLSSKKIPPCFFFSSFCLCGSPLLWNILFPFCLRVDMGSLYMCGSLGDFPRMQPSSHLVIDQILNEPKVVSSFRSHVAILHLFVFWHQPS